jgi:hypothetical protein
MRSKWYLPVLALSICGVAISGVMAVRQAASAPAGWAAFITSVQRPEAQKQVTQLMGLGLQKNPDVEKRLADYTGKLEAVK